MSFHALRHTHASALNAAASTSAPGSCQPNGGPRIYAHLINKVDRSAADATEKALAPAAQE